MKKKPDKFFDLVDKAINPDRQVMKKKTKRKPKVIKAWAIVNKTFEPKHPYLMEVRFTPWKPEIDESVRSRSEHLKVIPVEIKIL